PVEGSLFKAAWFRYYHIEEHHYLVLGDHEGAKRYHLEQLNDRFLTVDHAATVKRTDKHDPDYTVIASWLVTPCGMLVWLGCWIARCEIPDIPPEIGKRYLWYGANTVEIESGGTQKSVAQFARRRRQPFPRGDVVEVDCRRFFGNPRRDGLAVAAQSGAVPT